MNQLTTFTFTILLFLTGSRRALSHSEIESYYYKTCEPVTCGNVTAAFPFSSSEPFCGFPDYEIFCDNSTNTSTITISSRVYTVLDIHRIETLVIVSDYGLSRALSSDDIDNSSCTLQQHLLLKPNYAPFSLAPWATMLNFSWCSSTAPLPEGFINAAVNLGSCLNNSQTLYVFQPQKGTSGDSQLPDSCSHAAVPVLQSYLVKQNPLTRKNLTVVINGGFPLTWPNATWCWDCESNGGRCGHNNTAALNYTPSLCFCEYGECGGNSGAARKSRLKRWMVILVAVGSALVLAALVVAVMFKFKPKASQVLKNVRIVSISKSDKVEVKQFIKQYQSTLPSEYSYSDIKKFTNGFREKLGEGGYGRVYKGKLPNSERLIAVKILEKSKDDGRAFVNEIASIGRTYHVNVIGLLGFCCDASHRALIYEFMPEGSLGDLIYKEDIRHTLGAKKLLEIAVGIAQGIEYLHNGCEKRILHLDIKPQNVLLDNNFNPKISDFGLAKFHSRKKSVVTMTGAQGTFGYMAPEMIIRNLGGVSHKSDVYSFGMLLIEIVLGKTSFKHVNEESSNTYFPNWVYEQLEQWKKMEMNDEIVEEEDVAIRKKIVMVGLWCIQMNPVDRPSITTALGMLTGRIDCNNVPPKQSTLFPPSNKQSEQVEESLARSSGYNASQDFEEGIEVE